ncbi:MAG TPA: DUF3152 domain-containing protein [Patescibacteria group bacterium]|nr:DUF3152 domain-containing protein [Patescibacteria group bacterium]
MRIIDHRQFLDKKAKTRHKKLRLVLRGILAIGVAFLLANLVMGLVYINRVPPNYSLGSVAVGGKTYSSLSKQVTADSLLPKTLTFSKNGSSKQMTPAEVGLHVDTKASVAALKHSRPWFPFLSLFMHHTVQLQMSLDNNTFTTATSQLDSALSKEPVKNHIEFNGQAFTVVAPKDGYKLDKSALKTELLKAVSSGKANITVPVTVQKAAAQADLSASLAALQKQLATKISFASQGKTVTPDAKTIGSWYAANGQSMALSSDLVGAYLDGISPSAANRSDLVLAINYALSNYQTFNFAVVPKGSLTHTYCVQERGASIDPSGIIGKLAATYADTRGWNNNGTIAFDYASSGCGYTVWLSSASQMTSFGAICDNYYNCEVGTNVILNEDRWNSATAPWNSTGGSIEDYRILMINHETGHRLGFPDNNVCSGAGQPALVMMQQSVDLKGCKFNIWPLPSELAGLGA